MPKQKTIDELISLRGRRALITGATAGIGRAIAERFAQVGARLALVDLDAAVLKSAARQLKASGAEIQTYAVDVSQKVEIKLLWDEIGPPVPISW